MPHILATTRQLSPRNVFVNIPNRIVLLVLLSMAAFLWSTTTVIPKKLTENNLSVTVNNHNDESVVSVTSKSKSFLSSRAKGTTAVAQQVTPTTGKPLLPRMIHRDTNTTRPPMLRNSPYFIFHIGPPKTATTSFQYALTDFAKKLKQDSYFYLGQTMMDPNNMWRHQHGKILTILKDRQCITQVYEWRESKQQNEFLQIEREPQSTQEPSPPACWLKLKEALWERRQANHSIILSEENFSIKYADLGGQRDSVDWFALAELLAQVDYKPLVVIGYRRLFDIMPSAKQQWDRWTKTQTSLNEWPGPDSVGRILKPLFPDVLQDSRLYDDYVPRRIPGTIQWSYTDYLVKVIRPHLPIRLFNMHTATSHPKNSLRTYFLCHVLPYAPNACLQSEADDLTDPPQHYNAEESLFYDALAVEAANRQWFNTSEWRRHDVVLALKAYDEEKNGGKIQTTVPLTCPPEEQTNELLQRSLAKEEQLWPAELAKAWRQDHIEQFQKTLDKNKFCWIDINATLSSQPHWAKWFTQALAEPPDPASTTPPFKPGERVQGRRNRRPRRRPGQRGAAKRSRYTAGRTATPTTSPIVPAENYKAGDDGGREGFHDNAYIDG